MAGQEVISRQLRQKLFSPVDSLTAEIFLRFFGVVILLQVYSYHKAGFMEGGIINPRFLFTYDFFHWVKPASLQVMNAMLLLLAGSGILIALNKLRRIALIIFLFVFSWFFLLEKSYYNNHFYLFLLIGFLFLFYSPEKNNHNNNSYIPYWFLFLLQLQIVIVYFFGGVAKLNHDWIFEMQPMKSLLVNSEKNSALPFLNKLDFTAFFLTYGGLFFDICIGFFLWLKRTRKTAIICAVMFHGLNFLLFNFGSGGDIGIFPVMMIASNVLFIKPEALRLRLAKYFPSIASKDKKKKSATAQKNDFEKNKKIVLMGCSIYIAVQLLLPLRQFIYPGNTSWTGEGARFAWRMKVHIKTPDIKFYYQLTPADSLHPVNEGMIINTMQKYMMGEEPAMLLQFANYLGNELKKSGYSDPVIKASAKVSLNNRPMQLVVDSTQNLLQLRHSIWGHDAWILPLGKN